MGLGEVEQHITSRLTETLSPLHLEVYNESSSHNVPAGAESHFKVVVVATAFDGVSRIQRHRNIYAQLKQALDGPVHALAVHAYTPSEWRARGGGSASSPPCAKRALDERV